MSLSKNEQKIYELLKNRELYRNEKGIFTMCPQRLLVKLSGKNERTVQRALKGLEEQEYIRREWLAKEHLMLFYFSKEDFLERTIHDRYENVTHSGGNVTHSGENVTHSGENVTHSGENVTHSGENVTHSGENVRHSDENCRHSDENCRHSGENCRHSGENCRHSGENVTHSGENVTHSSENVTHSGENVTHSGENVTHSSENVTHSSENVTHSGENVTHSGENEHHSGENAPPSDENVRHSDESCTYSTDCTEKMSVTPQSVTENEHNSTICTEKITTTPQSVAENSISCTNRASTTKSHKKPNLPHLELSAVRAERMFYTMPDSSASHLLAEILSAGSKLAEIPQRKKQVNHSTQYSVMKKNKKRLVSMENSNVTVKVEIQDIDKLTKPGMMFFILSMIKANEQILHDGKISREYITFSLEELVANGMYSSERSARAGFLAGRDALTSLKVRGQIQKGRRKPHIDDLSVLFIRGGIDNNQCRLYMNPYVDWNFLAQYFTRIPKYFFGLSDNAAKLLYYIFYLARQHTQNIAEKGCFCIKFRAIQNLLNLPGEKDNPKPQETIRKPIEKAIEEIETEHSKMYGTQDFSILPVYDEEMRIGEYLDEGYLQISLNGKFATDFVDWNSQKEQKIIDSEKRKERILEKAVSINTAKAMENQKNK